MTDELKNHAIVLIDDECILCNSSAHYIVNRDKKDLFRIGSLLSEQWKKHLSQHGHEGNEVQTVVLIWDQKIYSKSDAVLKILELLGRQNLAGFLKLFPKSFRNFNYNLVSKYRYRIFGRSKVCIVPDEKYRSKFIRPLS